MSAEHSGSLFTPNECTGRVHTGRQVGRPLSERMKRLDGFTALPLPQMARSFNRAFDLLTAFGT